MATKTKEQRDARALQARILWTYRECLHLVRTKTAAEIEDIVRACAK